MNVPVSYCGCHSNKWKSRKSLQRKRIYKKDKALLEMKTAVRGENPLEDSIAEGKKF